MPAHTNGLVFVPQSARLGRHTRHSGVHYLALLSLKFITTCWHIRRHTSTRTANKCLYAPYSGRRLTCTWSLIADIHNAFGAGQSKAEPKTRCTNDEIKSKTPTHTHTHSPHIHTSWMCVYVLLYAVPLVTFRTTTAGWLIAQHRVPVRKRDAAFWRRKENEL